MPEQYEHRRHEETSGQIHIRASDHDKVAQYGIFWDRYVKFVIPIFWGIAIWFFTKLYPAVNGYPLVLERLQEADKDRAAISASLNILVRMQCVQLTAIDRSITNLDCSQIPLPTPEQLRRIR